jgi:MurNAc alpha-1-phosphate uridylyltransferase
VRAEGKTRLTYAGIGLYRPECFTGERVEHRPLLPLLQQWITAERVSGEHYRGRWFDVGTPERLAAAGKQANKGPF